MKFTFEAAHQSPPGSGLHGHSFRDVVYLNGNPDLVFGWTHNLFEVETAIEAIRKPLDHSYLNAIEGLAVPSSENAAGWIWRRLDRTLPGLDRVLLRGGLDDAGEGCCYSGHAFRDAA